MIDKQFEGLLEGQLAVTLPPNEPRPAVSSAEPPHHRRPAPALTPSSRKAPEDRHSRKCHICRHPDREQIEEDFLQWRSPWTIIQEYDIPESSLFRHAHAFGLFPLRRENMRLALDRVIERGVQVDNTGDTIIRAVRAEACLTDDGHWVEPAKRIIVTHINETVAQLP
jgi:hypothetical protein